MITPTNGRIVWYRPGANDVALQSGQPLAAKICHVHDDESVNLSVTDQHGATHGRKHVHLAQDGGNPVAAGESYCEWMPYQKGQAAKTEHLEKQLAPPQEQTGPIGGGTAAADPVPEHVSAAGFRRVSLEVTDREASAVAVAPRVALADIETAIAARFDVTADTACQHSDWRTPDPNTDVPTVLAQLRLLSICVLVMKNGFTIIGKSAPASPQNFNRELGRKFAYEDAVRQLWPLMGFALRDKLHHREHALAQAAKLD